MMKNILLLCCIALCFSSCKTVSIQQHNQSITAQSVTIGSVGLHKDFVLDNNYTNTAIPTYSDPIKVSVLLVPFTKQTHKAFSKANVLQNKALTINYVDSLDVKPAFLSLKIIDKVALIQALNSKVNKEVKNYLSTEPKANIVTTISMALNKQQLDTISQAQDVFLVQNGLKSYGLQLYNNGKPTEIIHLSDAVVFAYNTAHCCWKANSKTKASIVDISSQRKDCPFKTYDSATQAKNKINYFKL